MYQLFATKEDVVNKFAKYHVGDVVYNRKNEYGAKGVLQSKSKMVITEVHPLFNYCNIPAENLFLYQLQDKCENGFSYTAKSCDESVSESFYFCGNELLGTPDEIKTDKYDKLDKIITLSLFFFAVVAIVSALLTLLKTSLLLVIIFYTDFAFAIVTVIIFRVYQKSIAVELKKKK